MIKITMKNSAIVKWQEDEYSDYGYDGKYFIIIKDGRWIGYYNLDYVISIIVK